MNRLLKGIKQELSTREGIKIISFDIFDTILFRAVRKPVDVFEAVAEVGIKQGYLKKYMTPAIYKNVRIEAEKKAREKAKQEKGTAEVTLEEIIDRLPSFCCKKEDLLRLELEKEVELCYLNPDILEVISYLKQKKYTLILTSDMYLSAKQVSTVLEKNGFLIDEIQMIYMSSEIKKDKNSGTLYQYILEEQKWLPNEVLHIGDNHISDVVNPKYLGIHTVYYDVISNNKYMELQMEQMKYGNLVPEIYALRRYLADKAEEYEKPKQQWYRIGAMIMGPIMTQMAEWVLDTAREEHTPNIYPLMREGEILTRLLQQAAKFREEKYQIEPMYVSRKAIFLLDMKVWDEKAFKKLFEVKGGSLKTVLDILHIAPNELVPYFDIEMSEANNITVGSQTLKEYLKEVLLQEKIKTEIEENIFKRQENFYSYLNQIGFHKDLITVDLGIHGTMPKALSNIIEQRNKGIKNIHLYMFGAASIAEMIADGIDIRGYVGNAGENEDLSFLVDKRPYIWEQFMMCETGTTVGYDIEGKPITKGMTGMDKEHYRKIAWCQEGMLEFQKEYLKLRQSKTKMSLCTKVRDNANIVFRMITLPTQEEVGLLGDLQHDENYGVDEVKKICDRTELEQIKSLGIDKFLITPQAKKAMWVEGLVTSIDKKYYLDKILENIATDYEKAIVEIVKKVIASGVNKVIVAGAGEAGKFMKRYLELYGISLEAFTDNNSKLQGSSIEGVPVKSLQDNFNCNHYVIASFAFAKEIRKQIVGSKGEEVVTFGYEQ